MSNMYKLPSVLIVFSASISLIIAETSFPAYKDITAIPDDIPICSEADSDLNECLRNAWQQMLPRAKNGIPELNIPPIDPLEIEKSSYEFTNNIIQGKVALRSVKIHGLSKVVVNSIEFKRDGDKIQFAMKTKTPSLFIEGKYKAEVKVNDAKMNSKGEFNLTMSGIDAQSLAEGELYDRNGKKYLRLISFNIDPTLKNMKFYATGIMPDPILNDAVLEFINQNWRTVYKSLIPETRSTWEPEILKVSNEYFSHVPFDLLLLKN